MERRNFTPFPVLKTERLTLRQLASSDADEIFALRSDGMVNKYLDRKPCRSIDDAKTFIQAINENIQKNNSIYWAITLSDTDKLIGTICLFDFSNGHLKAEIGYELLPGFQKKGIMQEAISEVISFGKQHIGLSSIEAFTHAENQSSIRLLEKFNFKSNSTGEGNLMMFIWMAKS
jgi:ribosomal-protein-alanine N-acetyltransferase